MNNQVWVGSCTVASAPFAFRKALEQLSIKSCDKVRSIAIKINICDYRKPESGAVTDPLLLGCLLGALDSRFPGAQVSIVENDATTLDIRSAFRLLGFERVAAEYGALLHNVGDGDWISKPVVNGRVFKELDVPAVVANADIFINFAKLKTNALTKTTGCLKNIFGLLRQRRKIMWHQRIDDVLVDMNKVIRPHICLIDGVIGMQGIGGPAFGVPKKCDLLIAGTNPVSVDACGARIMGFRPGSIRHLRLCHRAGIGSLTYQMSTDIQGFDHRAYRFQFEYLEYLLRNLLRNRAGVAT